MKSAFMALFLLFLFLPGQSMAFGLHSSEFDLSDDDLTPPEIYIHPINMTFLHGSGGYGLTWAVRDDVSTQGGYFIDLKNPEVSSIWITIQTFLWYADQNISISLNGYDQGTYYFRFRAHDEAINWAEYVTEVNVASELNPPDIEFSHSYVYDSNSSHLNVEFTVSDSSGIRCIVFFYTSDGINWENITSRVAEPSNNKVINGQSSAPMNTIRYRISAQDLWGTWGFTSEVDVTDSQSTSSTPIDTTDTLPATTDILIDDNDQIDDWSGMSALILPIAIGSAVALVLIAIAILFAKRFR